MSATGQPAETTRKEASTNGRLLAFKVLREHRRSGVFVGKLLDEALKEERPSGVEVRLAKELTAGVVRRKATLNALIQAHSTRPRHKVEADLWLLLQLGVYQLVFLTHVPPHAAVNETVELAKQLGRSRWTGFVNAVLRSLMRSLTDRHADEPAAEAVPLNGPGFRCLNRPVFAEPSQQPVEYFTAAFSFPTWLARRWHRRFGTQELFRLGTWFNTPPRLAVRPNRLKTTREELERRLREAVKLCEAPPFESEQFEKEQAETDTTEQGGKSDGAAQKVAWLERTPLLRALAETLWLEEHADVRSLPGFDEGLFVVQDPVAAEAVYLLSPLPGENVLDLCAGPGTKTTLLAELMENRGCILATDSDPERLQRVEENCQRVGASIVETRLIADEQPDLPEKFFDAVLVDVPCSNTGVLGKRPEARWRVQPSDLLELTRIQRSLLKTALRCVRPGGRVVYSTCSIEPEENEQTVQHCLTAQDGVELVASRLFLPGRPSDGAFQALIRLRPDQ